METMNRLTSLNQRIKSLVDKCQDLEPPVIPPPLSDDDLMGLTPLSEEIYLSSINRSAKAAFVKCSTYLSDDLIQYIEAWIRYQEEKRGVREGLSTVVTHAVVAWWRLSKKKLSKGKGVKLPDWQCKIIHTEYAKRTGLVHFHLPREVHTEITTAIKNGHIYANWNKATMSAIARIALQIHHSDNHKHLLKFMKENKWHVDFT